MAGWNESKHPRDTRGRFASIAGGAISGGRIGSRIGARRGTKIGAAAGALGGVTLGAMSAGAQNAQRKRAGIPQRKDDIQAAWMASGILGGTGGVIGAGLGRGTGRVVGGGIGAARGGYRAARKTPASRSARR
jgi:uncharacterized protein YcfJ